MTPLMTARMARSASEARPGPASAGPTEAWPTPRPGLREIRQILGQMASQTCPGTTIPGIPCPVPHPTRYPTRYPPPCTPVPHIPPLTCLGCPDVCTRLLIFYTLPRDLRSRKRHQLFGAHLEEVGFADLFKMGENETKQAFRPAPR